MTPSPALPVTPASERDSAPERDTPEKAEAWAGWFDRRREGHGYSQAFGHAAAMLTRYAALLRPAAPGWRAKALEWRREPGTHHTVVREVADTILGQYDAWGGGAWTAPGERQTAPAPDARTLDAAKAAAQADFASRLAACIEPAASEAGWRDNRPMSADEFMALLLRAYEADTMDAYDITSAMSEWIVGDWKGALSCFPGDIAIPVLPPPPASPEPSADSVIERVEKRIRQGVRTAPNRFSINSASPEPQTAPASEPCLPPDWTGHEPLGEQIALTYTNWRGETAARTILPAYLAWGSTEWHPEPQWLLRALDVDKGEPRDFALRDCNFTAPAPASDPVRSAAEASRLRIEIASLTGHWISTGQAMEALRAALAQNGGEERGASVPTRGNQHQEE